MDANTGGAKRLEVSFGALSPPLAEQVPGLFNADLFQADADAITRCFIRGYIAESTAHTARKRLMREITKAARGNR